MKKIRCAIYTRKSTEDGLEQEFNSLDAQREACAAYITSQKNEGWVQVPGTYDDGGLSGGTLARPGLQHLLADIRSGKVDRVIVYKIDRLTRSLSDFVKIVDIFDDAGATFVSVTQSFNTATSMGRLTLNMLLSFAQFEREVTAERIRDKIAASKKKGLWMGGTVPLGYEPDGRTLKIKEPDAQAIRTIYDLYRQHGTIRVTKYEVDRFGLRTAVRTLPSGKTTGGACFSFGHIYYILTNPIYAGRIRHKALVYPGQHAALINPDVWGQLQEQLKASAVKRRMGNKQNDANGKKQVSLLIGKVFDETGDSLTPSHTKTAKGRRLRYYVSHRLIRSPEQKNPSGWRLPGPALEDAVAELVAKHLNAPETVANIIEDATTDELASLKERLSLQDQRPDVTDPDTHILVERVDISPGKITIALCAKTAAEYLDVTPERINSDFLVFSSEFQHRKRGVETKLIVAGSAAHRDEVLFKNIARAHRYFALVRAGQTYAEIAKKEGVSRDRVQKLIELAFLAPDVIRDVYEGNQPLGLTTQWLLRHAFPTVWHDQREMFRPL
jgi:DNA invertase Pin-like site-specific DNA recombinase